MISRGDCITVSTVFVLQRIINNYLMVYPCFFSIIYGILKY